MKQLQSTAIATTLYGSVATLVSAWTEPYPELCLVPGMSNTSFTDPGSARPWNVSITSGWTCGNNGAVTLGMGAEPVTFQSAPQNYTYNATTETANFGLTAAAGSAVGSFLNVSLVCNATAYGAPLQLMSISLTAYPGRQEFFLLANTWQACRDRAVIQTTSRITMNETSVMVPANTCIPESQSSSLSINCNTVSSQYCFYVADFGEAAEMGQCNFSSPSFNSSRMQVCNTCVEISDNYYLKLSCVNSYAYEFYKCTDFLCGNCDIEPLIGGNTFKPDANSNASDATLGPSCVGIPGSTNTTVRTLFVGSIDQDCETYEIDFFPNDNCTPPGEAEPLAQGDWNFDEESEEYHRVTCINQPRGLKYKPTASDSIVVRTSEGKYCANSLYETKRADTCFTVFNNYTQNYTGRKLTCDAVDEGNTASTMCAKMFFYDGQYNNTACPFLDESRFAAQYSAVCNTCNLISEHEEKYYGVNCDFGTQTVTFDLDCELNCQNCRSNPSISPGMCTMLRANDTRSATFDSFFQCNSVTVTNYADEQCQGDTLWTSKVATLQCNGHSSYQCVPKQLPQVESYRVCECECTARTGCERTVEVGVCTDIGDRLLEQVTCDLSTRLCLHGTIVSNKRPVVGVCNQCEDGTMWDCDASSQTASLLNFTNSPQCIGTPTTVATVSFKQPIFTDTDDNSYLFDGITECEATLDQQWFNKPFCFLTPIYSTFVPMGVCTGGRAITCGNMLDKPILNTDMSQVSMVDYSDATCSQYTNTVTKASGSCIDQANGEFVKHTCYNKGYCFNVESYESLETCQSDTPIMSTSQVCDMCTKDLDGKYWKYECDVFGETVTKRMDCDPTCTNCTENVPQPYFTCGFPQDRTGSIINIKGMHPCDVVLEEQYAESTCTGASMVVNAFEAGKCNSATQQRFFCNSGSNPSTPTPAPADSQSSSGLKTGMKILIAVVIIVVLGVLAFVGFVVYRKKQQGTGQRAEEDGANDYELMQQNVQN